MGKVFKSILRVLAIIVAVLAICLLLVAAVQFLAPSANLIGASDSLLAGLPGVGEIFASMTPMMALGLGLLGLVVAFMIDKDGAKQVTDRVSSALRSTAQGVSGAITSVGKGLLEGIDWMGALVIVGIGYVALQLFDGGSGSTVTVQAPERQAPDRAEPVGSET